MAEVWRGKTVYTGVVEKDGKMCCEKCGGNKVKADTHIDAETYCIWSYKCRCGNKISATTERKWGGA